MVSLKNAQNNSTKILKMNINMKNECFNLMLTIWVLPSIRFLDPPPYKYGQKSYILKLPTIFIKKILKEYTS